MAKSRFTTLKKRILIIDKLANGISMLLHPLMMPTVLFGIITVYAPSVLNPLSEEGKWNVLFMIFLATFLMPLLMVLTLMFSSKKIVSFDQLNMHNSRDRFVPFMLTGLFYLIVTYYLFSGINTVILLIMFGVSAATILVAIISYFWKISAHAVAINGIIGYLFFISWFFKETALFYPLITLIILSGIVSSARLFLNAHTPGQVLAGFLLGLSASGGTVLFISLN